jgi:hypothetical protein
MKVKFVTLLLGCVSVASAAMEVDLFVHKDKFGMLLRSNIIAKRHDGVRDHSASNYGVVE